MSTMSKQGMGNQESTNNSLGDKQITILESKKMTEQHSEPPLEVPRDLVKHYKKKCDKKAATKLKFQDELEFKQGELANEKRMRQWLETRLDKVVRALASKDGTQKFKEEYNADDLIKSILALTQNDLMNEKRLRQKLEETVLVLERAKDVELHKKKYEEDEKIISLLQGSLETTEIELTNEKEMVRVLEETIADLERPIIDELMKDDEEDERDGLLLQQLEEAQCGFLIERKARQSLERKLADLEAAMPSYQTDPAEDEKKIAGEVVALERMHDELLVERNLRKKLQKKLKNIQEDRANSSQIVEKHEENKDEENMLQTLLRCTIDKLSNERKVRRVLEEKLEGLEQAVMKEQTKTKFEEIFLELTQNELTQEREERQILEKQLANLETARVEELEQLSAEDDDEPRDNFDKRLDALDKIIMSIQTQNKYVEEQIIDENQLEDTAPNSDELTEDSYKNANADECKTVTTVSSEDSSLTYCIEFPQDEPSTEQHQYMTDCLVETPEDLDDEAEFSNCQLMCLEDTKDTWQVIKEIVNSTLEPGVAHENLMLVEDETEVNDDITSSDEDRKLVTISKQQNEQVIGREMVPSAINERCLDLVKLKINGENERHKKLLEVTLDIALPVLKEKDMEHLKGMLRPMGNHASFLFHTEEETAKQRGKQEEPKEEQEDEEEMLVEKLEKLGVIKRKHMGARPLSREDDKKNDQLPSVHE